MRVDIERPEELGADLVAGAAGAKALYRLPAVVVYMGTATKLTAVLEDGTSVAAITGEVPLAVSPATSTAEATSAGTVFVVALSLDPNRLDELVPYAALALDSTRLLSADEMPAPYPPEDRLVATDAED